MDVVVIVVVSDDVASVVSVIVKPLSSVSMSSSVDRIDDGEGICVFSFGLFCYVLFC